MQIEEIKDIIINRGYVKTDSGYVFDGRKWEEAINKLSTMFEIGYTLSKFFDVKVTNEDIYNAKLFLEECEISKTCNEYKTLLKGLRSLEAWDNVIEDIKMYEEIESAFASSYGSEESRTIHKLNESIYQHCERIIHGHLSTGGRE